ncbi:MAG: rcsC [Burkholderiaceae bacterium]|nr:rcsC [Burkholderiaceae bacterium]
MAEEEGFFDLVLSDYHLGLSEENGLKLLKIACDIQLARPPICILITGDTTIDLIDKSNEANFQLLHKPIRPARLRLLLNNLFTSIDENITMDNVQKTPSNFFNFDNDVIKIPQPSLRDFYY